MTPPCLQRLKQTSDALLQAIERLESDLPRIKEALLEIEVEDTLNKRVPKCSSNQGRRLLSVAEVCQVLQKDKRSVYQLLDSGELVAFDLEGTIRIRQADVEEYLKAEHHRLLGDQSDFVEQ